MGMKIVQEVIDGVMVLQLVGRLDVLGSQVALDGMLNSLTPAAQGKKIVLDMSECDYVASSGLRTLLIAAKQAVRLGGKLVMAAPQPLVLDIITTAGFDEVIELYPALPDAIAAVDSATALAAKAN